MDDLAAEPLAAGSDKALVVQNVGDCVVHEPSGMQLADTRFDLLVVSMIGIPLRPSTWTVLGRCSGPPIDLQPDPSCESSAIDQHVIDQKSKQLLPVSCRRGWRRPDGRHIPRQGKDLFTILLREDQLLALTPVLIFALELFNRSQSVLP